MRLGETESAGRVHVVLLAAGHQHRQSASGIQHGSVGDAAASARSRRKFRTVGACLTAKLKGLTAGIDGEADEDGRRGGKDGQGERALLRFGQGKKAAIRT